MIYLRRILIALFAGLLAGLSSSFFLHLLEYATNYRSHNLSLIYFLPFMGLIIGYLYYRYGGESNKGNNLILEELQNPKKTLPFIMAPFVMFGTILTHLFGGSAGREGTAVQMGASLADQLNNFFKLSKTERRALLCAGAAAGFGAAIGTPFAGVIFGMEMVFIGKLRLKFFFDCLIASYFGYFITLLLKTPHSVYPEVFINDLSFKLILMVLVSGICFGLLAFIFSKMTKVFSALFARFISYAPLRPFIGGVLLVIFFQLEGSFRYLGLGIEFIQESFLQASTLLEPLYKSFFTSLTLAAGFKGGEFTPLVFIGSTFGSFLGGLSGISTSFLAALGFAAVFAGASNTPLACSIMAIEYFGFAIAPYAFMTCYLSYFFSGYKGIYSRQAIMNSKLHIFKKIYNKLSRRLK